LTLKLKFWFWYIKTLNAMEIIWYKIEALVTSNKIWRKINPKVKALTIREISSWSFWWNVAFRLWIIQFVFFWPHVETNKKIQRQRECNRSFYNKQRIFEWLLNDIIHKRQSFNDFDQASQGLNWCVGSSSTMALLFSPI